MQSEDIRTYKALLVLIIAKDERLLLLSTASCWIPPSGPRFLGLVIRFTLLLDLLLAFFLFAAFSSLAFSKTRARA